MWMTNSTILSVHPSPKYLDIILSKAEKKTLHFFDHLLTKSNETQVFLRILVSTQNSCDASQYKQWYVRTLLSNELASFNHFTKLGL